LAITARPYATFLLDLGQAVHNFPSDTYKVALLSSSYTPNYLTHATFADISGQITGTGYTAGGATLSNVTWTIDQAGNVGTLSADPVTWSALTATCRYAVVYRSGSGAATSRLVGLLDFGEDRVYTAEPFQLSFPAGALAIASI